MSEGSERFLTLIEAAELCTSRGLPPTSSKVLNRYVTVGVLNTKGMRIHLQAVKWRGSWVTTATWLDAFIQAVTLQHNAETKVAPRKLNKERIQQAIRECEQAGL